MPTAGTHHNNTWYKKKMERLRATRGNRCQHCRLALAFDDRGQPNLQWAHIQPTGLQGKSRGQNHRIRDIIRNPGHYLLLCVECHRRYDNRLRTVAQFADDDLVELNGHRYIAYVSESKVMLLPVPPIPDGTNLQPLELTDSQLPALNVQLIEHNQPMSIN